MYDGQMLASSTSSYGKDLNTIGALVNSILSSYKSNTTSSSTSSSTSSVIKEEQDSLIVIKKVDKLVLCLCSCNLNHSMLEIICNQTMEYLQEEGFTRENLMEV
ncbi:hypothetical protein MP638_002791 [Amoeboaphelidium occidentale]|nr:hypothetical protein MP638_002791 [Amoeboaphelidium occidentale]